MWLITLILTACNQVPKEKTLEEEFAEIRPKQIDFFKTQNLKLLAPKQWMEV